MNETKIAERCVPRMRTAAKIVAEIKALDPGSDITEYRVRQMIKRGDVAVTWAGKKALVDLDDVLDLLRVGTRRTEPEAPTVSGIRKIDIKRACG